MKTITVKQPWASLIVAGIKDIENRTWPTKYRGTVLIHAGAKAAKFDFAVAGQATMHEIIISSWLGEVEERNLFSAIIGKVDIVDCVINHPSVWAERSWLGNNLSEAPPEEHEPDHIIYNWVLANPVQFDEPILNVKGKLSFWEWEGRI